jgi:beta-lactamase class A
MHRQVCTILFAALFATGTPAMAEDNPPRIEASTEASALELRGAQMVALLNGELSEPFDTVFTPEMLAAVSPTQLTELAAQLLADLGRATGVESLTPTDGGATEFVIRMERALARGLMVIDPAQGNRISGLQITGFEPIGVSVDEVLGELAALPGEVSAYFGPLDGGAPVLSVHPDAQMALGSTFKLYVLAALAEDIAQGKRAWSDVVALDQKSFPSGVMQDWPAGAPVTLHTLASLMISISDNTATDQLIAVLGRERILRMVADSGHSDPARNDPFLTTRELFELKGGERTRLEGYAGGNAQARREILAQLAENPVTLAEVERAFSKGPVALDVEWFASPNDLARLFRHMDKVADKGAFAVMAISPNLPESARGDWAYSGFKGGSEPGVLNLTWLLTDQQGKRHILTLGWNNPAASVDEKALELIVQRILALPR